MAGNGSSSSLAVTRVKLCTATKDFTWLDLSSAHWDAAAAALSCLFFFFLSLSFSPFSLNLPKGLSNLERGKRCRRRRRRRLWRIPLHTSPSFSLSLTYWFQSSFAVLKTLKSLCHLSVIVHFSDTSTAATAAAASVPWKRRISLQAHQQEEQKELKPRIRLEGRREEKEKKGKEGKRDREKKKSLAD